MATSFKPVAICQVSKLRDRLFDRVLRHYCDTKLTWAGVRSIARQMQLELGSRVSWESLADSLRYLVDYDLTTAEAVTVAWRLAGNLDELRAGRPVLPWSVQTTDEWVGLQLLRLTPHTTGTAGFGYRATCRLLTGLGCPGVTQTFWSRKFIPVLARHLGFTRSYGKYPYQHPLQLVGLRFLGLVEASASRERPTFRRIRVPQSLVKWNRQNILNIRLRIQPCPRQFVHPCHRCAVGWVSCPAAVHRLDYFVQPCAHCGADEAFFDPEQGSEKCLRCLSRERATL